MTTSRLAIAALVLGATVVHAQARPAAPQNASITTAHLRADLEFLSGDNFRGRLTDTPENALALEWVKSRFERAGLEPMGANGGYFLPYNLSLGFIAQGNDLAVTRAGATNHYSLTTGFYPLRFSGSGEASGEVMFAHFGIRAPALRYDDLAESVRGKILIMLDHEPGENDSTSAFDGVVTSEYSNPLKKALAAQRAGAAGVLFVTDVHNHATAQNWANAVRAYWPDRQPHLLPYTLAAWADSLRIPVGQIAPALADSVLRATGHSLAELSAQSESKTGSAPIVVADTRMAMRAAVARKDIPDRNVVAAIEGSDPKLKHEYVIVTSHVDHNGAIGDTIYHGTDDNGSGAVALLEIADAYAKAAASGQRPKRSVLFLATNSEERGPLMGSWGYTEFPAVPLANTVAMINMDMIGRNEEVPENGGARFRGLPVQSSEQNANTVTLLGWSRSSLVNDVERANTRYKLTLKKNYDNNTSQLLRRSDSWPFLQHGVPAIWFHTGLHPDYHLVTDTADRINYEKMTRIARLVHQLSWDLANTSARPALTK